MDRIIKVLYVEDDIDIRVITELALEDEGFELIVCESGNEAVRKAEHCQPDLLLLDVMMPGMDGPTTLMRLREMAHLDKVPAIFMTAKVQPSEVEGYFALGAIGVIEKPFDPLTLADKIRELLQDHKII
ncbi:response regulator [Teredinibacter haidensis]|uniref:response regulator n=1 Tax=Teredinibacter haidensis TaxID=2731755 RepID=UPI000949068F|nr:response regulator [Teredinibacter haidensis]